MFGNINVIQFIQNHQCILKVHIHDRKILPAIMTDLAKGNSFPVTSSKDGKYRRLTSGKFECLLCQQELSTKQKVLQHLNVMHELSPLRRVQKRYLDDDTVPVPKSTFYRWKKTKQETSTKKSLNFHNTDEVIEEENSQLPLTDEITMVASPSRDASDDKILSEDDNSVHNSYQSDDLSIGCGGASDNNSLSDYLETGGDNISLISESITSHSDVAISDFDVTNSDFSNSDSDMTLSDSDETNSDLGESRINISDLHCSNAILTTQEDQALKLLSCFLRNNMSASTCRDILNTLNEMYQESSSVQNLTYENIWKFVDNSPVIESHYCTICFQTFPEDTEAFICAREGCEGLRYKGPQSAQSKTGRQPRQSFVFADVKTQLSNLLQSPGVWSKIQERKEHIYNDTRNLEVLEDITDGEGYQKLMKEGEFLANPHNITAILNTDGVNLYSSSRIEMWPIFLAINEFPPAVRFARENMLLVGMWQGKGKPPFQTYIDLLSKQLNQMYDFGIQLETSNQDKVTVKMAVLCGIFDLPAKASILNMSYFNGSNACITCEEPGEVVTQGRGHSRCYPFRNERLETRTDADVRMTMGQQLSDRNRVKGFKGKSGLMSLKGYDLVQGTVPDYMHGVLLGVTKTLMYKWFSPTESKQPYFVGNKLKVISCRLQSIKPLETIERLPRDIEKHYSHFKATELQAWLLYYAIPCLIGILPKKHLDHFGCLSEAVFLLLGSRISQQNLVRAEFLLSSFYKNFGDLYPKGSCGLNVHNIGAHLTFYVKTWGPIWAWSCFAFEDANAMLLQSVHGTGNVIRQVMRVQHAKMIVRKFSVSTEQSKAWKNLKEAVNCWTAGSHQPVTKDAFTDVVMQQINVQSLNDVKKVQRVVCGGQRLFSEDYSRMKKRDCCSVLLQDGKVASIKYFVLCQRSNIVYAVGKLFQIEGRGAMNNLQTAMHLVPVKNTNDIDCFPVDCIVDRLLTIGTNASDTHNVFISKIPNVHGHSVFK